MKSSASSSLGASLANENSVTEEAVKARLLRHMGAVTGKESFVRKTSDSG